jgi:phosphate transport system permease protein
MTATPVAAATQPAALQADADQPRKVNAATADDRFAFASCLIGSGALVWVVYDRLLPFSGTFGFIVCWYFAFLAIYVAVTAMSQPRPIVIDKLAGAVVQGGALVVFFAVLSTIFYTFVEGRHAIMHLNFFTQTMRVTAPTAPLNQGGILHAILGTLIEIGIAVILSFPLGVGTGVYMAEVGGGFARIVRTVVEAMTALPDIVAGLFIYTTLIVSLSVQTGGLAAACALAVTMVPIIARTTEVQLRIVPGGLREASLALGTSRWRTVRMVVLPTARAGLATAVILGIARAIGETAAVLLTSGESNFLNVNPINNPMNSLPLYIYHGFASGELLAKERYWGAASVLLVLVLVLFVTARVLARSRLGRS